ncbi:MAG TPA: glutamate racemase [Terriglobia bacterium]|nr:glutamate racemase [Terriglobia bacterium]
MNTRTTSHTLGFFDSGFGGLSVVREIRKRLPQHSFVYLGDNGRTPYGSRPPDVIHRFTLEGVQALFNRGAALIVLACNTSSSVALRRIQQEYLPVSCPDRRVLGIVIPTAEEVSQSSRTKIVGVLATEATVASQAYPQEIFKVDPVVQVRQQACPALVPLIEAGDLAAAGVAAREYVDTLVAKNPGIDTILLGCTHYALIEDAIRKVTPAGIRVVSQGSIVAEKLVDYLVRHPEMAARLDMSGAETFLTTAYSERIERLGTLFYGSPIVMETIRELVP